MLRSILPVLAASALAAGASVAQQLAEFERLALPSARERTAAIAAADIDGDGQVDLVVAPEGAYPGRALRLLIGQGDGRFVEAPAGSLPADQLATREVVLFDADADGDVDVFVACQDFQQNRLWLNAGSGVFVDRTATLLPSANDDSRAAVAFDVEGDGDLDLVVTHASGPGSILLNDGSGAFTLGPQLPVPSAAFVIDLTVADVEADGDDDLLLSNALGADRLLLNDGTGTFVDATATRMPPDPTPSTAAAVLDFEGDGDPDFVVVNHGVTDHFLINDGNGGFTRNVQALPGSEERGADVAVIDFDQDGDDDLCIADRGGADFLWRNDGAGIFRRITGPGWPVVLDETTVVIAFDADGDGDDDLVCGGGRSDSAPGRRRLLLNAGGGEFLDATATHWPSCDRETLAVAVTDLDGDGSLDVLVGGVGGWLEAWFGDGTGRLALDPARMTPSVNGEVRALATGDVDGDGDIDVAVGIAGQSALLINTGSGRLVDDSAARLPRDADDTQDVALADFDRDGDLDMMLANAGPSPLFAQQNRLFENDGNGNFTDVTTLRLPARADFSFALGVGDVDGDADLDVVVGNWHIPLPPNPAQPSVLLINDGSGTFAEAAPGRMPPDLAATAAVALGDVDGDLDLDLITVHAQGSPDYLYLNDGGGRFTLTSLLPGTNSSASYDVALGDLDDDGDLDVVIGRRDQRNVVVRNDGNGTFVDVSSTIQPHVVDGTAAVRLADIDGDQDLDVVVGNRGFQKDRLLINRLRQIEAPYLARASRDWPVDVHARGLGGAAIAVLWLSPTRRNDPVHFPPFGHYRLGILPPLDAGPRAVDPTTEVARYPFVVPQSAALLSMEVWLQGVVVPVASPFDLRLTGLLHAVVRD